MGKINNSFKIPMNKPNMRIVTSKASRLQDITFEEIWMLGVMWIPSYQMPPNYFIISRSTFRHINSLSKST